MKREEEEKIGCISFALILIIGAVLYFLEFYVTFCVFIFISLISIMIFSLGEDLNEEM